MNGRQFDAQVVLTDPTTPRGQLMSQYVCTRINSMSGIDIGLFEFDRHNAIYFFVLNADEQIYLRYGGRDPEAANTYLDLESFERALERGLELHEDYQSGRLPRTERPKPEYPRDLPLLREKVIERNRCVECHLIDDYRNQQLEREGKLDKLRAMYRSPDIKTLGIHLDVPKGLVLADAGGAAAAAGMQPGDEIVAIGAQPVATFGDLQFHYDKLDRRTTELTLTVRRSQAEGEDLLPLTLSLPAQWWRTDLSYRYWSVEPKVYYRSEALGAAEKQALELPKESFASRVVAVDLAASLRGAHSLEVGDVITAVDGEMRDPVADTSELHIKLRKTAGASVQLTVRRGDEQLELPLKTGRQSFRK